MQLIALQFTGVEATAQELLAGSRSAKRKHSVRRSLRRGAVIISIGAAPCRDESRDRARANRPPESFINGLVFTFKGFTLTR